MKKFLSVILAALILVCPISCFATEVAKQTLEWNFCDDDDYCDYWTYSYKGDMTLGENEITFTEDSYCDYYTFNAENAGYYYVEYSNNDYPIDWLGFPEEIIDGKAQLIAKNCSAESADNEAKTVFSLDAGETVLGIDFTGNAKPTDTYNIKIEYLGNAITDITFEEGVLENLVLDVDLYDTDGSYVLTDVDALFSDGKTITFPEQWILINSDNYDWVKGENKATAYFMDFKKSVVITACEMTELVTDVEFVNLDKFKNIVSTFEDIYSEEIYGAELVLTLANGEKITTVTDYEDPIEINGRDYYVYAYYNYIDAESAEIRVSIGGETIGTFECDVIKSTLAEGGKNLISGIGQNLKDSFYYSRVAFSEILRIYDVDDIEDTLYDVSRYFKRSINCFKYCFALIQQFMNYYF